MRGCDLPRAVEETQVERFRRRARDAGWTVREESGWLLLDRPELLPRPAFPPNLPDGEAGCVLSLLQRHPELWDDLIARRALAKASELSTQEAQRVCLQIHRRWALTLAEGNTLVQGRPAP